MARTLVKFGAAIKAWSDRCCAGENRFIEVCRYACNRSPHLPSAKLPIVAPVVVLRSESAIAESIRIRLTLVSAAEPAAGKTTETMMKNETAKNENRLIGLT